MSMAKPSKPVLTSIADLRELLRDFDALMLVTREADGGMHARPMTFQDPSEIPDCDLWLVSSAKTPKVHEIQLDEQVAICGFRDGDPAYVAVTALARIEHDPEELRRVFKPDWKAWMPGGPDDPTSVIIKLTVLRAECWSQEGEHYVFYPERARAEEEAVQPSL